MKSQGNNYAVNTYLLLQMIKYRLLIEGTNTLSISGDIRFYNSSRRNSDKYRILMNNSLHYGVPAKGTVQIVDT